MAPVIRTKIWGCWHGGWLFTRTEYNILEDRLVEFRWKTPHLQRILKNMCQWLYQNYIQYLIHWLLCQTPFTRITSHNLSKYGLFQSRFQYGLFQNSGLHTCFGLNLNRGLNKTNVFVSEPSFTQRVVLHKTVLSTNTMFHTKTMFLLGLCKGCFCSL